MKAAILENGTLSIKEIPKPSPGAEQALVRLTASGVCHSDVHLVKGDWPKLTPPSPSPFPIGHEGIGVVEALGPGADKYVHVGERVILGLGGLGGAYWCGACEFCLSGRPRLCPEARPLLGTHALYIATWAKALVQLPDEVGDREVSLACGGLTAYSAIKKLVKFGVTPGKPIALIGAAGGLGHYAIQIARTFGYVVMGVDVGREKIDFIKSLGADYAIDASEAAAFVKQKFKGVSASIVFTPKIAGFELGLKLLKRGGVFVSVGMPAADEKPLALHPLALLQKEPLIMASAVGTVEDMRELVQLASQGKVKTHISREARLSEVQGILEELDQGRYTGRAIITDMAG
ncbi:MAG: zinc-dependent alcohol dehydrogenase [Desulfobacteraceae bacterium]|nr:MAG: zinc-dependent alcohol dehydrogenase [Desulfobacteraceae bacterium]